MICGSKRSGDKYESKFSLASRIVKIEQQVCATTHFELICYAPATTMGALSEAAVHPSVCPMPVAQKQFPLEL